MQWSIVTVLRGPSHSIMNFVSCSQIFVIFLICYMLEMFTTKFHVIWSINNEVIKKKAIFYKNNNVYKLFIQRPNLLEKMPHIHNSNT